MIFIFSVYRIRFKILKSVCLLFRKLTHHLIQVLSWFSWASASWLREFCNSVPTSRWERWQQQHQYKFVNLLISNVIGGNTVEPQNNCASLDVTQNASSSNRWQPIFLICITEKERARKRVCGGWNLRWNKFDHLSLGLFYCNWLAPPSSEPTYMSTEKLLEEKKKNPCIYNYHMRQNFWTKLFIAIITEYQAYNISSILDIWLTKYLPKIDIYWKYIHKVLRNMY